MSHPSAQDHLCEIKWCKHWEQANQQRPQAPSSTRCCFRKWFKLQIYNCTIFTIYKKKQVLILTNSCNWDFFLYMCVYSDFYVGFFLTFIFVEEPRAFSSSSHLICLPVWYETQVVDFIVGSNLIINFKVLSSPHAFVNNYHGPPLFFFLPSTHCLWGS